jgi:hypothetical protein
VRPATFVAGKTTIALSITPFDSYGNEIVSQQAAFDAYYYLQSDSPSNASALTSVQVSNLAISLNITRAGLYWLSIGNGGTNISGFPTSIQVTAGECDAALHRLVIVV